MTHRPQEPGAAPRQLALLSWSTVVRLGLAVALGAGGGAAERRLVPATAPAETVEHANQVVEFQLRLQHLEDELRAVKERAAEDRGRIGELEHQVRPASYRRADPKP